MTEKTAEIFWLLIYFLPTSWYTCTSIQAQFVTETVSSNEFHLFIVASIQEYLFRPFFPTGELNIGS